MVGRKAMQYVVLVAAVGACGPAARPEPQGPTQAELEARAKEQARLEQEARERAKAEQMASPGMTRARAIEVCKPEGQRAYLSRLRCPGGSVPTIVGRSSVGLREPATEGQDDLVKAQFERAPQPGEPHLHVVDRYDVDCGDGKALAVFLDMYHCPAPASPIAAVPLGLELAAEGEAPVEPMQAAQPDGDAPPAPADPTGGETPDRS